MTSFLYKLMPRSIKNELKTIVRNDIKAKRQNQSNTVPYTELSQKHIANLKVILNRTELLKLLPHHGVVAELGVDKGAFSEKILTENAPEKLHLVDVWKTERYHEGLMNEVMQKFKQQIENNTVKIDRGFSTEVGKQFPNEYFDWIYIDTNHSYKTTKEELELYANKVKKDGIIAGHDFVIGNWKGDVKYGVIEAVYEFCVSNDWQLLYLTTEMYAPSFAIQRIGQN